MPDGYTVLIAPLVTSLIAGVIAVALYFLARNYLRAALDSSRVARFIYVTIAVIILPLILGGWSDVVDLSDIVQGKIEGKNALPLSILATLFVLYLFLHGCWFDREEHSLLTRQAELGRISELDCQRNYLLVLLENFRACIGRYAERLRGVLEAKEPQVPVSQRIPDSLARDNIRMIVESVRQTYKTLETVPKDYTLKVLLLEGQDNFLVHRESYDGTNWDCYKADCDSHKEQYFNLAKPRCSAAVGCAVSGTIEIIEDCEECHRHHEHPFCYFHDCHASQRDELGSMVVIPFELEVGHKFVLCVNCSQPRAFLKKHRWKANAVRENIQARLALLFCQTAVLDSLKAESEEYSGKISDLECQLEFYKQEAADTAIRINQLENSLVRERDTIKSLTDDLSALKSENSDLEGRLATTESNFQTTSSELEGLKISNGRLEAELKEMKADVEPKARTNRKRTEPKQGG